MRRPVAVILGIGLISGIVFAQATLVTDAPILPPIQMAVPLDGPISALTAKGGTCGGNCFVVYALNPDRTEAHVQFKLSRIEPVSSGSLLFVSPSSGTTPETVYLGVNESVLHQSDPGRGAFTIYFSTVDQSPASETAAPVILTPTVSPPAIRSILSAAAYQTPISPGGIVAILGANLAPPRGVAAYDAGGLYSTTLGYGTLPALAGNMGNTTVKFNDIAAPLLYVSPSQVNAMVPYGLAGQKTVTVVVTRYYSTSAPFVVPLADTSPGIFTATQNGSGQGAILNVPVNPNDPTGYTYNSLDNPAPKGSVIVFYATGAGVWDPPVADGSVSLVATDPLCTVKGDTRCRGIAATPISLTIGGQSARILYAGSAPYQVWGMIQVNATIPDGIGSGRQPIVLTIGGNDNSQQQVTVAVK